MLCSMGRRMLAGKVSRRWWGARLRGHRMIRAKQHAKLAFPHFARWGSQSPWRSFSVRLGLCRWWPVAGTRKTSTLVHARTGRSRCKRCALTLGGDEFDRSRAKGRLKKYALAHRRVGGNSHTRRADRAVRECAMVIADCRAVLYSDGLAPLWLSAATAQSTESRAAPRNNQINCVASVLYVMAGPRVKRPGVGHDTEFRRVPIDVLNSPQSLTVTSDHRCLWRRF